MPHPDLVAHARALLAANRYLTLATADQDGNPWISPLYFASASEREFYWMSATDAQHSRNLAGHPPVSIAVFDSTVVPGHGRGLYAVAEARELSGHDLDRGLEVYPGPSQRGGVSITRDDVTGPSPYRLYRATVSDLWVLCPREPGQPCPLHGFAQDHRTRIE